MSGDGNGDVRGWERKILLGLMGLLVLAFFAWAGVVWNGTGDVVSRMDAVLAQMNSDRLEQERYRAVSQLERQRDLMAVEKRLVILEQRQAFVLEQMRKNGFVTP